MTIEETQTKFTAEDCAMFDDKMKNPPPPTERMKKALELYHKIKKD
jgi:uncharacterized protein (DUF1778 family)